MNHSFLAFSLGLCTGYVLAGWIRGDMSSIVGGVSGFFCILVIWCYSLIREISINEDMFDERDE